MLFKLATIAAIASAALAQNVSTAVVTDVSTALEVSTAIETITSCSGHPEGCFASSSAAATPTEAPVLTTDVVSEVSTVVDVETTLVTVTHCTGSDVVSCHYVTHTSTFPAAATTTAAAVATETPCSPEEISTEVAPTQAPVVTSEAPAPPVTEAPCPSSSQALTTFITVSEGVTVTLTGPVTGPTGGSNSTNATIPQVTPTEAAQVNGQSQIQVGVAAMVMVVAGALLL